MVRLNSIDHDHVTVVGVRGELIMDECERLRKHIIEQIELKIHDFVVDCHELEHIDSKGLETLIWIQEHCADYLGQMRLAACPEHMQKILDITRLQSRFTCLDSVNEALESLR
ncbi:STAS domain-containing protein [Poriferisphaera sp. WC338]|uniref:STAS domain-containing protein n=1 Tax=Poriferisphaera sp. WC338 TaxID=3425129 RepID=UPI003D816C58